jgi:predicted TIM-barrel fold metal-dependent hydrolase
MTVTDQPTKATESGLPFLITDADEHSTPRPDAYLDYIDPNKRDLAITTVTNAEGLMEHVYAGKPARIKPKNYQVTFSDDKLEDVGVHGVGGMGDSDRDPTQVVPGSLLNKLNPLKGLDAAGRIEFARRYRELADHLDNPADRLVVMDSQGVEAAVNYASGPMEYEFEEPHLWDALYANQRAGNRYLAAEWGYSYENRIFTPPSLSTVDAEAAIKELDAVMNDPHGAPKVIHLVSGPSIHRSPFRPELDPFWARLNEAHINICTHLAGITFYGRQGSEWDEQEVMLGDMNAFQWMMYYGDRPAYETVAAAILQGLFARFPNIQLLLSEQGTVWVPYIVRKMDHAFLMGRKATWGKLEMRPSEYFRQHVRVAPFPEENVHRVVEAVGVESITFGSDFPHGEGLPEPSMYLGQLAGMTDEQVRAIMRSNLAEFLGLPA